MDIVDRALTSAKHKEPDKVPFVLLIYGLRLKEFFGITEYEYYQNFNYQLQAKLAFIKRFPEVLLCWSSMSTLPEGGYEIGAVATAFGGKMEWMKDAPPWVKEPAIKSIEDIDKICSQDIPDPRKQGVSVRLIEGLKYFNDWFPLDVRRKYCYIDGNVGPSSLFIEGAALAIGYDKWLTWLYMHPKELKKFHEVATKWYIEFTEALSEIVEEPRFIFVPDHSPSFVNKEQFKEFILPYFNEFFGKYKKVLKNDGLRIWHNEGRVGHMLEEVDKIDAEVWQFGASEDLNEVKNKTHFCLMGNLDPPSILLKGSPEEVYNETVKIIKKIGEGGGLWISSGGGVAPKTPFKNLEAIIKAINEHGKYKLGY